MVEGWKVQYTGYLLTLVGTVTSPSKNGPLVQSATQGLLQSPLCSQAYATLKYRGGNAPMNFLPVPLEGGSGLHFMRLLIQSPKGSWWPQMDNMSLHWFFFRLAPRGHVLPYATCTQAFALVVEPRWDTAPPKRLYVESGASQKEFSCASLRQTNLS